jgi:hypothetical protein
MALTDLVNRMQAWNVCWRYRARYSARPFVPAIATFIMTEKETQQAA